MDRFSIKETARSMVKALQGKKSFHEFSSLSLASQSQVDEEQGVVVFHSRSLLKNSCLVFSIADVSVSKEVLAQNLQGVDHDLTFRITVTPQALTCLYRNEVVLEKRKIVVSDSAFLVSFLESTLFLFEKFDEPMGSRELAALFGIHSPLYFAGIHVLEKQLDEDARFSTKVYDAWLKLFDLKNMKISELRERKSRSLLLNHLYFLMILLTVVVHQSSDCHGNQCLKSLQNLMHSQNVIFNEMFHRTAILSILLELCEKLHDYFITLGQCLHDRYLAAEDLFRELYQQLTPLETRQVLGEFYTPVELARLMVRECYQAGMEVLDPACGSGTFIVEIVRHLFQMRSQLDREALEKANVFTKIWGFDVHPLAIITTRVNLFLALNTLFKSRIIRMDSLKLALSRIRHLDFLLLLEKTLEGKSKKFVNYFDLIIGNPPWIVLNKIDDPALKARIKNLARKLDLLPPPHQVSNLEVSALFFHGARYFLKMNGILFLIVSNAFLTGDNHSRTRQFTEFDEIEAWKFDTDLFRIHSTCIQARHVKGKNRDVDDLQHLKIKVKSFFIKPTSSELNIQLRDVQVYIPYMIEPLNKKSCTERNEFEHHSCFHVRKFIPERRKTELLPLGRSYYHEKCFNGAVLGPRNLLFVKVTATVENQDNPETLVEIVPVIVNPKKPWDFNPLTVLNIKKAIVERRYVFSAIRSTNLVPFVALKYDSVFLPIEEDETTGGYRFITNKNAKGYQYFQQLDQLYQKYKKTTQSLSTLWANINYQNKLTAPRQRSPFKVVMQGSGTIVKAAVINDPRVIVDSTNYLIACESLNEAHYLVGILNAPRMTATVRLMQAEGAGGGGRHIQKRPFTVAIPKYDENNTLHLELSRQARLIEKSIKSELLPRMREAARGVARLQPMRLQNIIFKRYQGAFHQLDQFVSEILGSHFNH